MLPVIVLLFAFVCFNFAAFVMQAEPWRGRLVALGLACWVMAEIILLSAHGVLREIR